MKTTTPKRRKPPHASHLKPLPKHRRKQPRLSDAPIQSMGVSDVGGETPDSPPRRPTSYWAAMDQHPLAELMQLRERVAAEVDRLIAFLDATDGEADFEPEDDESNLAGFEHCLPEQDEAEADTPDDESTMDEEPSLGFLELHHGQDGLSSFADGGFDIEAEHDGSEPSLGWTAVEASRGWGYAGSMGQAIDLEAQCEDEGDPGDNGVPDTDGMLEQYAGRFPGYGTSGFARCVI